MKKLIQILITVVIILLFILTTPKKLSDFGYNDYRQQKYYKVNNYLLFSTCSASYQDGKVWKVHQIGVLGTTIKVKPQS